MVRGGAPHPRPPLPPPHLQTRRRLWKTIEKEGVWGGGGGKSSQRHPFGRNQACKASKPFDNRGGWAIPPPPFTNAFLRNLCPWTHSLTHFCFLGYIFAVADRRAKKHKRGFATHLHDPSDRMRLEALGLTQSLPPSELDTHNGQRQSGVVRAVLAPFTGLYGVHQCAGPGLTHFRPVECIFTVADCRAKKHARAHGFAAHLHSPRSRLHCKKHV